MFEIALLARRTSSGAALGFEHPRLMIALGSLLLGAMSVLCMWFVLAVAGLAKPPHWPRALACAVGQVVVQMLWTALMAAAMLDLAPWGYELMRGAALAAAVLLVLASRCCGGGTMCGSRLTSPSDTMAACRKSQR